LEFDVIILEIHPVIDVLDLAEASHQLHADDDDPETVHVMGEWVVRPNFVFVIDPDQINDFRR